MPVVPSPKSHEVPVGVKFDVLTHPTARPEDVATKDA
jgi:hypothetical protein